MGLLAVAVATFTPPQSGNRGFTLPDRQEAPWSYMDTTASPPYSANVYKLLDGTYTETQPVSNAAWTAGWELLDTSVGDGGVYYGGHSYEVSAAEAAALTAAGYGAYIA